MIAWFINCLHVRSSYSQTLEGAPVCLATAKERKDHRQINRVLSSRHPITFLPLSSSDLDIDRDPSSGSTDRTWMFARASDVHRANDEKSKKEGWRRHKKRGFDRRENNFRRQSDSLSNSWQQGGIKKKRWTTVAGRSFSDFPTGKRHDTRGYEQTGRREHFFFFFFFNGNVVWGGDSRACTKWIPEIVTYLPGGGTSRVTVRYAIDPPGRHLLPTRGETEVAPLPLSLALRYHQFSVSRRQTVGIHCRCSFLWRSASREKPPGVRVRLNLRVVETFR